MNRLLLIAAAVLALSICGMAKANYQYGSGLDDRFDRNRNDLRHFNDHRFERDLYDFRPFDDRDDCQRNEWRFERGRDDLQYFDDRPFKHDINDLRYSDTGVSSSPQQS